VVLLRRQVLQTAIHFQDLIHKLTANAQVVAPQPIGGFPMSSYHGIPGISGIPSISSQSGMPSMPSMPSQSGMPSMPSQSGMPSMPSQSGMPSLPSMPSMPSKSGMPSMPSMPTYGNADYSSQCAPNIAGCPSVGHYKGSAYVHNEPGVVQFPCMTEVGQYAEQMAPPPPPQEQEWVQKGQAPKEKPNPNWRSLLLCYFPREAKEKDLQRALEQIPAIYGQIKSIFISSNGEKSKCFGFANFTTHDAARIALLATEQQRIVLDDRRGVQWTLKARGGVAAAVAVRIEGGGWGSGTRMEGAADEVRTGWRRGLDQRGWRSRRPRIQDS